MKSSRFNENLIINTIMNSSQDTLYFKDKDGVIILSSKTHALLWGLDDPNEAIGKTDFDYFPKDFAQISYKDEENIMKTGIPVLGRIERLVKPDGSIVWLSASKYPFYDAEGDIIGTWGISKDITLLKIAEEELMRLNKELEKANKKLKVLSVRDSLSDLYNHRHFFEELTKTFDYYARQNEKGDTRRFSIILFDIDNFKTVNDTHGHLMGDFVIKHIADIIKTNTRSSDSCFRYGGDEFAILLPDTDLDIAKKVAEKIRGLVEKTPVYIKDIKLQVTISMGVGSFDGEKKAKDIVEKVDKKLYLSKQQGKNKIN